MLYYRENTELTECKTYRHSRYKPRTGRWRTLVAHKKTQTAKVIHVTKDWWTHDMTQLISWCGGWNDGAPFWWVKLRNTLIVCIISGIKERAS
jgi:hypothetical protein